MIREITPDDVDAVVQLMVEAGQVSPDAPQVVISLLDEYFNVNKDVRHRAFIDFEGDQAVGFSYVYPDKASPRVWVIATLVVPNDTPEADYWKRMVIFLENYLKENNQRMLLTELSGLPKYEVERNFYQWAGFEEEARIRDFYKAGNDKVILRKVVAQ